jgi:hypothetical protein
MHKSLLAIAATLSLVVLSSGPAQSGSYYPYGDPPYTLNWGVYPQIDSGCWKWNWQLNLWNDHCPVHVQPKAYMYPRSRGVVLRTKG